MEFSEEELEEQIRLMQKSIDYFSHLIRMKRVDQYMHNKYGEK